MDDLTDPTEPRPRIVPVPAADPQPPVRAEEGTDEDLDELPEDEEDGDFDEFPVDDEDDDFDELVTDAASPMVHASAPPAPRCFNRRRQIWSGAIGAGLLLSALATLAVVAGNLPTAPAAERPGARQAARDKAPHAPAGMVPAVPQSTSAADPTPVGTQTVIHTVTTTAQGTLDEAPVTTVTVERHLPPATVTVLKASTERAPAITVTQQHPVTVTTTVVSTAVVTVTASATGTPAAKDDGVQLDATQQPG